MPRNHKKATLKISGLGRTVSVGEGFSELNAIALAGLVRQGAGSGRLMPADIHRFRTHLRRFRSLLSSFREVLPRRPRQELSIRLKNLAQRYGDLREWDVFLATAANKMAADFPDPKALKELRKAVKAARAKDALENHDLAADIISLATTASGAAWLSVPTPKQADLWTTPLAEYAPALLTRQRKRLRKKVRDLDLNDQTSFHKFRIETKKHRYTTEFFAFLFKKKHLSPYLKRLVEMQDILGQMNDAIMAQDLLGRLDIADTTHAMVMGWLAHEIEDCRDQFPACARAFRRTDPFWES